MTAIGINCEITNNAIMATALKIGFTFDRSVILCVFVMVLDPKDRANCKITFQNSNPSNNDNNNIVFHFVRHYSFQLFDFDFLLF